MAFYDLRDFLESCRKENDLIEVRGKKEKEQKELCENECGRG